MEDTENRYMQNDLKCAEKVQFFNRYIKNRYVQNVTKCHIYRAVLSVFVRCAGALSFQSIQNRYMHFCEILRDFAAKHPHKKREASE